MKWPALVKLGLELPKVAEGVSVLVLRESVAALEKLTVKEARYRLRHAWLQRAPRKLIAPMTTP